MDRNTRAHRRVEWQLLYLSTGELDLASHIEATQKRISAARRCGSARFPLELMK
jgi:hypothetical protein